MWGDGGIGQGFEKHLPADHALQRGRGRETICWFYSLALLVQMAAFLAIRRREPALPRPWRVPGGLPVALLVVAVPRLLALLAIATSGLATMLAGLVAALTGPLAYALFARLRRGSSLMTAQDKSQAGGEQDWGFEGSDRAKGEP